MWKTATLWNPPASASRGTPLWQGGLWSVRFFQPGNVTGHWRGSNDSQKATVRTATGGTPVSGHCPQGSLAKGSWHGAAVTEGFTESTSSKYKPMWKPASLLSPRFGFAKPPPQWPGGQKSLLQNTLQQAFSYAITSSPFRASTVTVWPGSTWPERMRLESMVSTVCCTYRRRGLAPYWGS